MKRSAALILMVLSLFLLTPATAQVMNALTPGNPRITAPIVTAGPPSYNEILVDPNALRGAYKTIASALTYAGTKADSTHRWVITLLPGTYSETGLTPQSYVTVRGVSRTGSIISCGSSCFLFNDTADQFAIENLTMTATTTAVLTTTNLPAAKRTHYIRNCNVTGIPAFSDVGGNKTWYWENSTFSGSPVANPGSLLNISKQDVIIYSQNNRFASTPTANTSYILRVQTNASGLQFYDLGSTFYGQHGGTGAGTFPIYGIQYNANAAVDTQATIFDLQGTKFLIESSTDGNTSSDARCFNFSPTVAPTNKATSRIRLRSVSCRAFVRDADTAIPINGFVIAGAGMVGWQEVSWIGGSIDLVGSGGGGAATAININQNVALTISGVKIADTITLSGSGSVVAGDTQYGAFSTFLGIPSADLAQGSCTLGQVAIDTGGATKEYCVCATANAWSCWRLDTGVLTTGAGAPID